MRFLLFAAYLLLALPVEAQSSEEQCIRIFRVSTNDYPPLFFLDASQKPSGLSHDLINELHKRTGCTFVEEGVPAPRAISDFSSYRTDLTGITPRFAPLEPFGEYIPLYKTARILVFKDNKKFAKGSIAKQLANRNLRFADQIGGSFFYLSSEIALLKKENRLVESPNPISSYQLVNKGRADAFFSSPVLHHYYKKQLGSSSANLNTRPDPSTKLEVGLYLSRKKLSKQEHDRLLKVIQEIKKDGTLKKILRHYLGEEDIPYYENL